MGLRKEHPWGLLKGGPFYDAGCREGSQWVKRNSGSGSMAQNHSRSGTISLHFEESCPLQRCWRCLRSSRNPKGSPFATMSVVLVVVRGGALCPPCGRGQAGGGLSGGQWQHDFNWNTSLVFSFWYIFLIIFYWLCYYSCPDFFPLYSSPPSNPTPSGNPPTIVHVCWSCM